MFQFPRFPSSLMILFRVGCPIRISWDHCLLATPPSFSQRCHVLLRHLTPRHPPYAHSVFPVGTSCSCLNHTSVYVRYILVLIFLRQGTPTFVGAPSPLNRDNLVSVYLFCHYWGIGIWMPCGIKLPRKEVIQPHLPVRLPCYDFVPVATPALGRYLLAVSARTSGIDNSHDVTGGVYKPRVRIHRAMLIRGY
jgi:hypothetical protein